jgi:hypothetical protein
MLRTAAAKVILSASSGVDRRREIGETNPVELRLVKVPRPDRPPGGFGTLVDHFLAQGTFVNQRSRPG